MERDFFGNTIRQRIDNEMLCLSDLSKAYDKMRIDKGWPEKKLAEFFRKTSKDTNEYVMELVKEGDLVKGEISHFTDESNKNGVLAALKKYGLYKMKGKGEQRAVYAHPYIFVAIAMWMNPSFRARVTIWITDQLIFNRIEAGERYNILSKAIRDHIVPQIDSEAGKKFIYSNFAKLINKKIFGEHATDLRQAASKEDLRELVRLQDKLSALIEVEYIKTYDEAKDYIQKLN